MPTPKQPTPTGAEPGRQAFVLRVELRDLTPAIWREVWVAPGITLRALHRVIQAAMGWHDAHRHGFAVPGPGRAPRYWDVPLPRRSEPRPARDDLGPAEPAGDDARTRLDQVMAAPGDTLLYLYDFGDEWEHLVTLKRIVTTAEALPLLEAGVLAGPPDDCGGPGGYMHLAEVLRNPRDPEHAELREWVDDTMGPDWVPGELSDAEFQRRAAAVARSRPPAESK